MKNVQTTGRKTTSKIHATMQRIDPDTVNSAIKVTNMNLTKRTIHKVGPRGFQLSPKWYDSIKRQRGVAVLTSNLPKLIATAKVNGVRIPPNKNFTPREIAEKIAVKLNG